MVCPKLLFTCALLNHSHRDPYSARWLYVQIDRTTQSESVTSGLLVLVLGLYMSADSTSGTDEEHDPYEHRRLNPLLLFVVHGSDLLIHLLFPVIGEGKMA
jgi:hypothetical protein